MTTRHYLLFALLTLIWVGAAARQKEYRGIMHATPILLEQKGDSLHIKLVFEISGANVDSKLSISLIPALVTHGFSFNLPAVEVKGRNNYNLYRRQEALKGHKAKKTPENQVVYAVVKGFPAAGHKRIEYDLAVRYEDWMADAKLDIYEDLSGCGALPRRMGVSTLANHITSEQLRIVEMYEVAPMLTYVQPTIEQVKHRVVEAEVFLDFAVNATRIRPDYMNNPEELKKITDLIARFRNDPEVEVNTISVTGYASPEGAIADNQLLSEKRARAMIDYLQPQFDYPGSMYKVTYGGENWDGLKNMVERSDMPFRDEVLHIIATVPAEIDYATNTSRKKSLMLLGSGAPYIYMLQEFFPALRKAVCKIDYTAKEYDIEKARVMIRARPYDLSLNEMFLLANSYEKGSDEFIEVFESAVRIFTEDPVANLNAAFAALERKDIVSAERYLNRVTGKIAGPEYDNAAGVLALLKGELNEAEAHFRKAAAAGLKEAEHNLNEVAAKRNTQEIKPAVRP